MKPGRAAGAAVAQGQVLRFEQVQESGEQGQFVLMLVALDVVPAHAGGHALAPAPGLSVDAQSRAETVTVALSRPRYEALKRAVENARTLPRTVAEMERVSRQVLFDTLPDTRRRKRLSKKVLGLS